MNVVEDARDIQHKSDTAYSIMGSTLWVVCIPAMLYAFVVALYYHNRFMAVGAFLSIAIMILAIKMVPGGWSHTRQLVVKNLLLCMGTILFVLSSCTFFNDTHIFVKNGKEIGHVMFIRPFFDDIVFLNQRLSVTVGDSDRLEVVAPSRDDITIRARISGTVEWELSPEAASRISELENPNESLMSEAKALLKAQAAQEINHYPAAVLLAAVRTEAMFNQESGPPGGLFRRLSIPYRAEVIVTDTIPFRSYPSP